MTCDQSRPRPIQSGDPLPLVEIEILPPSPTLAAVRFVVDPMPWRLPPSASPGWTS